MALVYLDLDKVYFGNISKLVKLLIKAKNFYLPGAEVKKSFIFDNTGGLVVR